MCGGVAAHNITPRARISSERDDASWFRPIQSLVLGLYRVLRDAGMDFLEARLVEVRRARSNLASVDEIELSGYVFLDALPRKSLLAEQQLDGTRNLNAPLIVSSKNTRSRRYAGSRWLLCRQSSYSRMRMSPPERRDHTCFLVPPSRVQKRGVGEKVQQGGHLSDLND